jgi:hypothetical protein
MKNSVMTEKDFWDMFNKKHNPRYYYATKKTKEEKTKSKKKGCDNYSAKRYSLRESKGGVG